jgi:hypothetical protein
MRHTSPRREEPQIEQQEQPRWRPTGWQVLWTLGIIAILTVVVLIGYRYGITLWDWIQLLIVPAVIAGGGLWFNRQQRARELETEERRRQHEQYMEDQRAKDAALQAYFDQMAYWLLDKGLRDSKEDTEVRIVARARTLDLLLLMDHPMNKRSVLQFLYESRLLQDPHPVLNLDGAYLVGAYLWNAELTGANLAGVYLNDADLRAANLHGACLHRAYLVNSDLTGADIRGANLNDANLSGATVTYYQLLECRSLAGATMPNGQKYAEWLKDNGDRGDDEATSSPE